LNRWAVVGSAWLIATAALVTWLRTTPSFLLREQLAVLQFWSLEVCVFLGLALAVAVAADLRRAIQWRDGVGMAVVAALALGLTLSVAPRTNRIYYDEQIYQNIGQNLADSKRAQMCNDGTMRDGRLDCRRGEYNKQPYAYPHVLSLLYRAFGVRMATAFVFNAIAMALTVCAVYLIVVLLFSDRVAALFAALLFALIPEQLIWSASAASEPSASLASAAAVLAAACFVRWRTSVSLAGTAVATAYAVLFTHTQVVHVFGTIACVVYILDRVRIHYPELLQRVPWVNSAFFRAEEQFKESAMIPYAIAILLTILTFPQEIALIAIYTLAIADPVSAMVGITWGRRHIVPDKSVEGSLGFLVVTFLVTMGGDIYSDYFGGGRRCWLNLYLGARIGYARLEHFPWKDYLDFYTCTECGRCSDNCPAFITGKLLSPKQLTLDLRDRLYGKKEGPKDLVPELIKPEVLWACTTCRACEEQCPVNITYVDKIVQMRRNLVTIRGEFPAELGKPFEGMETNGNPWNLARVDRAAWTEGLDVKVMAQKPDAEVLFWVGCAASYDDRAKKIARATAQLLTKAGVDFAILADEETCTGDPARRAGNEYLFSMLAETNAATLNGYKDKGGARRVITTCPHCFNTLKNEYPDFGANLEVIHHTDFLLGLVAEKKLVPTQSARGKIAYHDSCYLGRYNDGYESPRAVLSAIPGVELVEVEHFNKKRGLCCGAGGAQMWMEEQNKDRVNVKRTLQLIDTGAKTLASACPFCMTMLTDGVKAQSKEEEIKTLDIAELLAEACGIGSAPAVAAE